MTRKTAVRKFDEARAQDRVTFDLWFRAQYGPEPSGNLSWKQQARDVRALETTAQKARDALDERWRWASWRDAALKAWVARDKK